MKTERLLTLTLILALVILLAFGAIYLIVQSKNTVHVEDMEKISYTVRSDEGFYDIACKYCPDNMDRWDYINAIRELNGFSTKYTLKAGERIVVYALPSDK